MRLWENWTGESRSLIEFSLFGSLGAPNSSETESELQNTQGKDKSKSSTTGTTSGNPVETTAIAQDSLMAKPEQESPTGGTKSNMLDSIKIIRGKKNLRKPTQKQKKGETDSQHTQIINIPLGKASGSEAGANKLTIPEEQKAVEKPNGKKIQFADKIVKSTITPGAKKCF
ncbi:Protein CBG26449 [Caenorhabditis briggsae]|uniref:Protein CBG26449 n=1 Tax=Caenorhabditis briggsae TaxID=6238 RepID=B6IEY6_CAEBR|nr:Protein CBG26449 [Caenorhabditis briggsae]CAR98466.1 Protein CBG26449 [Caenorhabditis briggsae]